MGRVLRIGAGVMGVLLVVMTAGLWTIRRQPAQERAMLLTYDSPLESRLVFGVPGTNVTHHLLWLPEGFPSHKVTLTDGDWLYFFYNNYMIASGTFAGSLYRVRFADGQVEQIVDWAFEGAIEWTPNKEWLVYIAEDFSTDTAQVVRIRPDGSDKLVLSADLLTGVRPIGWNLGSNPLVMAPDGQSVYFTAREADGEDRNVYRAWLSDGRVENLTAKMTVTFHYSDGSQVTVDPTNIEMDSWPGGENAFLVRLWRDDLYWMRPNGTGLEEVSVKDRSVGYVAGWLDDERLLMVTTSDGETPYISAVHPYDPMPVWEMTIGRLLMVSDKWVIVEDNVGVWWRIHRDTFARTMLLDSNEWDYINFQDHDPSTDPQWLIFRAKPDAVNRIDDYAMYRLNIINGSIEPLAALGNSPDIAGWSPDGKWLLYRIADPHRDGLYRMNWRTGETELLFRNGSSDWIAVVGFGPLIDKHWSVSLLILAGIALCMIGVARLRPAA